MFGQGATLLAIEFEGGYNGMVEVEESSSESSSESGEDMSISTPSREEIGKKRVRGGISFGNLSGISGLKASHEVSSERESSDDLENDVKKLKLTPDNDNGGLDTITDPLGPDDEESGELVDSRVEPHEEVPLEDPGPSGEAGGD